MLELVVRFLFSEFVFINPFFGHARNKNIVQRASSRNNFFSRAFRKINFNFTKINFIFTLFSKKSEENEYFWRYKTRASVRLRIAEEMREL